MYQESNNIEKYIMTLKLHDGEYNIIPNNETVEVNELKLRVKNTANYLFEEYGLEDWSLHFCRLEDNIVGTCYYQAKKIALNTTYFQLMSFASLKDILLHEIAHALVGIEHGHNNHWHIKALFMGCSARTTIDMELQKVGNDTYKMIFK